MRGVDVEVEQRGGVQAEFRCCWGLRTLASVSRAACCCDVWAAAREPDAGVVLRRRGCQLCGRGDQRAVVWMHVCDCCGLGLRELGLQRQGARGPRRGQRHGHEGRDGVRGVDVEVEQRGGVPGECGGRGGRADAARTGDARGCDVWAAARQPDGGVLLRRCGCELCGRLDQRAVVGMHVRHGCGLELRELGLEREGAGGARGCVVRRHDGRDGVRGVEVEVEQRG